MFTTETQRHREKSTPEATEDTQTTEARELGLTHTKAVLANNICGIDVALPIEKKLLISVHRRLSAFIGGLESFLNKLLDEPDTNRASVSSVSSVSYGFDFYVFFSVPLCLCGEHCVTGERLN
jgi:hypothetical protein